jgi:hypothetical protein
VSWPAVPLTAANTSKVGGGTLGTDILSCFTAQVDGAYLYRVRFMPLGTNIATVARVFLNNGGDNTVAANNSLIDNITLPAITNTETAGQAPFELPLNMAIDPSFRILIAIATAVANGWMPTVFGGDY